MTKRVSSTISAMVVGACIFVGSSLAARAHGELHEMIEKVSREIALNPRNPDLYLQRAELHRNHCAWDTALADLGRAEALSNQWQILHFARARLFLSAEWFESAKVAADRFLEFEPNHLECLVTRARVRVKVADPIGAAEDFTRAIAVASPPAPELYLERAQSLVAAGTAYHDRALQGLDEGLKVLGPVATLQLAAIDLELKLNRVEAALARLDQVMAQAPRRETWLARRGDMLRQAGRNPEAVTAFSAAAKELEALPIHRRTTPAMVQLETHIRKALAEINSSTGLQSQQ